MKRSLFSIYLLWVFSAAPLVAQADTQLIPLPAALQVKNEKPFVLNDKTPLVANGAAAQAVQVLAAQLRAGTGFALPLKTSGKAALNFVLDTKLKPKLGEEGYTLQSNARGVTIRAATSAGLFYGGQTLRGLLPPQAMRQRLVVGETVNWTVPSVAIEDQPRFAWRGFSLDEARHFFGMEYVKHLLDNMAARKMNVLQWHLTDDEGWRVEIKSLPKLTQIGAWRGSETNLRNVRGETHKRYGGCYTQEQIREIVAYARARHINIMPEIDLPGHAIALLSAYPETAPQIAGEGVSAQGFSSNVISPVRRESLAIVDKIYDEISSLFPFEYIHIGGDEVNHKAWSKDPQIKAYMERENILNLHDVQVAFTKHLEGIVAQRGKHLFGWNEILDDRLNKGTGIMSWTGTGPGYAAARQGFPVVMVPAQHSYLDMGYGGGQGEPESHNWAGDVTLSRIYAFDPLGDGGNLSVVEKSRILGVQAALWAEFVRPGKTDLVNLENYWQAADYKIWPRLLATAEVAWTPQNRRDFAEFNARLNADEFERLAQANTFFRVPPPANMVLKAGTVSIESAFPEAEIRYTLDGTVPTTNSPRYVKPFALEGHEAGRLRARTFFNGRGSTMLVGARVAPIGSWKAKELKAQGTDFTYDATENLTRGGIWRAFFRRTGGDKALRLDNASLSVNGAVVVTAQTNAIINRGDRAVARFKVPQLPPNAKVTLRANLAAPEGDNVSGEITLVPSERLEPEVKVTSTYPAYQKDTAEMAGDWDNETQFWIADYPQPGVLATWEFEQPITVNFVSLSSGAGNAGKDQLIGGELEISADGTTFRTVAVFDNGVAQVNLPADTSIKALRVIATVAQKTWTILRDPILR